MQVFVIAGEASGDLHGSNLIHALKSRLPQARFVGIGGPKMEEAGLELLFPSSDLAVVGVVEVIGHIRPILKAFGRTTAWLRKERPDLLILIDYPEFNLLVAGRAKKLGIPIFYYISPQVWAWRQGRVKKLRRLVDRMAVILPFEKAFFKSRGMEVTFVGHPLLDVVKAEVSKTEFCKKAGLNPEKPIVGLVPGSRKSEISRLFPVMAGAAERIFQDRQDVQFVVPLAPSLDPGILEPFNHQITKSPNHPIVRVVKGQTYDAIAASDLILAASGTVTLEAAILGTPMVVTYKVSPITCFLGKCLIRVPFASLVNLVAGRLVVIEIIQRDVTPERLSQEALSLLRGHAGRENMIKDLKEVKNALGGSGAAERAADLAMELISGTRVTQLSQ
ncbi:MAG: lipid-A-disaccharide synthase [Thermodesulfobacteriota bacterium]|nr:lipid-A-disaccharide synthase [Thermodesulfobacteriota bacterium]